MPIIKSAKKKMRKDKKKTASNAKYEATYKKLIDKIKKSKGGKKETNLLKLVFKAIDKAAKKHVIHKNKAARLKSRVAKLLSGKK